MPIIIDPPIDPESSVTQEIALLLIALLGTAEVEAFEVDELARREAAGTFPDDYAELHLSTRGRGDVRRSDGSSSVRGWRVQVRFVCRYVENVQILADRAAAVLNAARLVVDGRTSTPFDEGPADPPRPDDGWYSALAEWTFTL